MTDIDDGTIVGPNRLFTQMVATYFYEQIDDETDQPRYDGLYYRSSLGITSWDCWAIFDQRLRHTPKLVDPITPDDAGLQQAASLLELSIALPGGTFLRPVME